MTNEQFNNGSGKMSYDKFAYYCDNVGMDQAIWIAKYFGVALNKVKMYIRLYQGWKK